MASIHDSGLRKKMEECTDDDGLRKKMEECTEVIRKAYNLLKDQPGSSSSSSTPVQRDRSSASSISRPSTSTEMNQLFNWNPKHTVASKRKLTSTGTFNNKKSKQMKLKMWTHTFVCLARSDQRYRKTSKLSDTGWLCLIHKHNINRTCFSYIVELIFMCCSKCLLGSHFLS